VCASPFELPLLLLLPSTTARTIATITITTTPPPIASARGEAWRAPPGSPPPPFERTGGGVLVPACWRCCLARLPLGIGGKRSRLLLRPGGRKDQESDEKEEAGEREGRDGEVAEGHVVGRDGEPVDGAAAGGRLDARRRLGDRVVRDEHVVDRDARTHDGEREEIARRAGVATPGHQQEEKRERVHADPLVPAELARKETG